MHRVFVASDSQTSNVLESLVGFSQIAKSNNTFEVTPWNAVSRGSGIIIQEVLEQISNSDLVVADISTLNPNVLFEVGFAVGKQRQILLTYDPSEPRSREKVKGFDLLSILRRHEVSNADQLYQAVVEVLFTDGESYFDRFIRPYMAREIDEKFIYLKPFHENNAENKVSRLIGQHRDLFDVDDPSEAPQSLSWYISRVFNAVGVLAHLQMPETDDEVNQAAKAAFVAGFAHGLGRQLLLLAPKLYRPPFDYKTLLHSYADANDAVSVVKNWIEPTVLKQADIAIQRKAVAAQERSVNELRELFLGNVVAELDSSALVTDYFVETSTYREAISGTSTVFVGRKGVGKSATLLKLKHDLAQDDRALICDIRPESYEMTGLVRLLSELGQLDLKTYALQSLWKYLILTELAVQADQHIRRKPPYQWSTAEAAFVGWLSRNDRLAQGDFATRLEDAVQRVLKPQANKLGLLEWRSQVSQILHAGPIKELSINLVAVLKERSRVAILVDNLDKAWDQRAEDINMAEFLLALLSVCSDAEKLFDRHLMSSVSGKITLALFLRSDIFYRMRSAAREADKISYRKMDMSDPKLLSRLVEERFQYATQGRYLGREFWDRFFVEGTKSRDMICDHIFARPRDFIFCVQRALNSAFDNAEVKVRPEDLQNAIRQYSAFALDSVIAEGKASKYNFQSLLAEFVGAKRIIPMREVSTRLSKVLSSADLPEATRELCLSGFLGFWLGGTEPRFVEDVDEFDKTRKLANEYAVKHRKNYYFAVHKAFWKELEIQ